MPDRSTNFGALGPADDGIIMPTTPATPRLTNEEIATERRVQGLARQAILLAQVKMLSVADTIEVLKQQPEGVIILIDAHSATVKVPAFQFARNGALTPKPSIQTINAARRGYIGYPNLNINGAWSDLVWWTTPMKLDARKPDTTAFRPIDVVDDPTMVAKIIDWFKEMDKMDEGW